MMKQEKIEIRREDIKESDYKKLSANFKKTLKKTIS